jgi:hypothetical protein
MITKGALVIIKHGDKDMSNEMAKSIVAPAIKKDYDKLQVKYYFARKRSSKAIRKDIRKAQRKYGYNYIPTSKIIKYIREGFALVEYGFAVFVDKFMTIKIR